jgi:hypothetical protein
MDLILSLTPPPPIKSADFWHAPYVQNTDLNMKIKKDYVTNLTLYSN